MSISTDVIRHLASTKTCTKCGKDKSLFEFALHVNGADGFNSMCVECTNAWRREYRTTERGKRKRRDEGLRRWYGVTVEEYEQMLESVGYKCEICGKPPKENYALCLDHDHVTNKPRGILCADCNHALGSIRENLESAEKLLDYIKTRCGKDAYGQ